MSAHRPHRRRWNGGAAIRSVRVLGAGAAGVLAALVAVGWVASERAIHPRRFREDRAPEQYPFAVLTETVRFPSLDGTPLAGWFIPGLGPGAATVILLHEYTASRAQMLPHADYLHRAGYNVLLFDFRNRGESGGDAITAGAREPLDVHGAVAYLLSRDDIDPGRIAVQGSSLGASAGLLAMAEEPHIAAAVAECAFTDLAGAVRHSFRHFFRLPAVPFAPVTLFIVERRLRVRAAGVRPIDAIARFGGRPVLIIEDGDDDRIPPGSGRRLYDAAPGPKEYWLVEGAVHAEGFDTAPVEYERRVLAFYARHLGGAG
jgi:fermentation-respiration switch protein FrsA (DUF1100 family)